MRYTVTIVNLTGQANDQEKHNALRAGGLEAVLKLEL